MTDPTVFIVDDDDAIRDSLTLLLESTGLPVESYGSGLGFLARCHPGRRGCVLLDVQLPDLDGLAVQDRLKVAGIDVRVIMITARADVRTAVRAMRAGAVDFVEKPLNAFSVFEGVQRALRDETPRSGTTGSSTLGSSTPARRDWPAPHPCIARLTCREREVLEQLVMGKSNKAIALELGISPRTVEIHRARVMEKMEAGNIAELVRTALAAGVAC